MSPSLTKPRAFIFDLDGVIINSEPLHERATRLACRQHGIDVPDRVFDSFRGQTDRDIMRHLVRDASVEPETLLAAKHDAYEALLDELTLMPGALDFIGGLDEHAFPLALVTSTARHNQERTFAQFDLTPYFDAVVTADDVERAKPHPEPYRRAVQQLSMEPAACMVIEDSTHGVTSARRAGCMVVGLCSSFSAEALREAGAHQTVETYDELARFLNGAM